MGPVVAPSNTNGTRSISHGVQEALAGISVVFAQQVWIFYPYRRFEVRGALRYEEAL
jgi:hypothetical protein